MIRRRRVAVAGALAVLGAAGWQRVWSQGAPRRIGFLTLFSRADAEPLLALVRNELDKLGWTDGRNLTLQMRSAEGRAELLPALASELVVGAPDVLFVQSLPAVRALMQATKTIPILMISVGNPVEQGLVADYRKPGGNVSGSAYPAYEAARKLLQLLVEAVPRLRSVALFINPGNEAALPMARQLRADALASDLQLQVLEVRAKADFDTAFAAIRAEKPQAIMLPPEALILAQRDEIAGLAQALKLPLGVVGSRRTLPDSGLMAFTPSRIETAQIAARQADLVLRGARPGELPIERPSRFELVINLRAARALGLTVPQSLLLRADEVIE